MLLLRGQDAAGEVIRLQSNVRHQPEVPHPLHDITRVGMPVEKPERRLCDAVRVLAALIRRRQVMDIASKRYAWHRNILSANTTFGITCANPRRVQHPRFRYRTFSLEIGRVPRRKTPAARRAVV